MDSLVEMAGMNFETAQAKLEIAIFKAERRAYGEEEVPNKCVWCFHLRLPVVMNTWTGHPASVSTSVPALRP